jgi:hypothetical protein
MCGFAVNLDSDAIDVTVKQLVPLRSFLFRGHVGVMPSLKPIRAVVFLRDDAARRIVTVGSDRFMRLWSPDELWSPETEVAVRKVCWGA